jgi:hypothetical protein
MLLCLDSSSEGAAGTGVEMRLEGVNLPYAIVWRVP